VSHFLGATLVDNEASNWRLFVYSDLHLCVEKFAKLCHSEQGHRFLHQFLNFVAPKFCDEPENIAPKVLLRAAVMLGLGLEIVRLELQGMIASLGWLWLSGSLVES
jgi:hypothetical protein